MKIVLVDNVLLEQSGGINRYILQPHLGLASLAAVAESGGFDAELYDPKLEIAQQTLPLDAGLYDNIAERILGMAPSIVGFTSLGCNFICTVRIAECIRRLRPEIPILLGGPHATVLDREIMITFPQIDVIVRNEGELKLLPLLNSLQAGNLSQVPGITYRRAGQVVRNEGEPVIADLDELPIPAYEKYPIEELGLEWLRVEAGRGCPFHCTFCSTASFFGRQYRLKSAKRLVRELDLLNARYGIRTFTLSHDLFTVNRKKVLEFCEHVANHRYTWKCSARMDCVDVELLQEMARAGCTQIYYGIEAGSQRMQNAVQKRLDLSLVKPILDATESVGMAATTSFITGYPEENNDDQLATLDLVGQCLQPRKTVVNVQLHLLTPEPGTRMIKEFGDRLAFDGHISDFNFPSLVPMDSRIMRANPGIFMNHFYYSSILPRQRHVFITNWYQLIYNLGSTVLTHLTEAYYESFGRFVERFYFWACNLKLVAENPAPKVLIGFLEQEHGIGHHLCSLARFFLLGAQLSGRLSRSGCFETIGSESPNEKITGQPGSYSLSHRAGILRNIHYVPSMVCSIEKDTSKRLTPNEIGSVSDMVAVYDPSAAALKTASIESEFASLLESIASPMTREGLLSTRYSHQNPAFVESGLEAALQFGAVIQSKTIGMQRPGRDGKWPEARREKATEAHVCTD
jgi:radical SAM superfamily enzyme YgiQ (UPF0313 family)